jgi:hypothetical protein
MICPECNQDVFALNVVKGHRLMCPRCEKRYKSFGLTTSLTKALPEAKQTQLKLDYGNEATQMGGKQAG